MQSGKSSIASSFTLESKANSTVNDNKIAHENVNNQGEMPHQKKVAASSNAQEEHTDFSSIRNAIKPVTTIQLDEKLQMLRCVNSIQYSDSVLNIFSFDRYDIHHVHTKRSLFCMWYAGSLGDPVYIEIFMN